MQKAFAATSNQKNMVCQTAFRRKRSRLLEGGPDHRQSRWLRPRRFGKGCTIGTTMTVTDKAVPNVVGVDIGCGMYTVCLGKLSGWEVVNEGRNGREIPESPWFLERLPALYSDVSG